MEYSEECLERVASKAAVVRGLSKCIRGLKVVEVEPEYIVARLVSIARSYCNGSGNGTDEAGIIRLAASISARYNDALRALTLLDRAVARHAKLRGLSEASVGSLELLAKAECAAVKGATIIPGQGRGSLNISLFQGRINRYLLAPNSLTPQVE